MFAGAREAFMLTRKPFATPFTGSCVAPIATTTLTQPSCPTRDTLKRLNAGDAIWNGSCLRLPASKWRFSSPTPTAFTAKRSLAVTPMRRGAPTVTVTTTSCLPKTQTLKSTDATYLKLVPAVTVTPS